MKHAHKELLNDVLKDIATYGAKTPCVVYLDRKSDKIRDYLMKSAAEAETKEKDLYMNEKRLYMSLFECLCVFIEANLNEKRKNYKRSIVLIACRYLSGLTQMEFGKLLGSSYRAVQHWEYSTRRPPLNILMLAAIRVNVDFELVEKYLTENPS